MSKRKVTYVAQWYGRARGETSGQWYTTNAGEVTSLVAARSLAAQQRRAGFDARVLRITREVVGR